MYIFPSLGYQFNLRVLAKCKQMRQPLLKLKVNYSLLIEIVFEAD